MIFDPLYMLFVMLPAGILGAWAHFKVKAAYAKAEKAGIRSGMSGAEAAHAILRANGLSHVTIEPSQGMLSDHYDPKSKALRLSPGVYQGRSAAAVGIAAHEAGHAIQDGAGYMPLKWRNSIVPMASLGSGAGIYMAMFGMLLGFMNLVMLGAVLYAAVVVFQLINLPVEFNASRRARELLVSHGIVSQGEMPAVSKVLNAAALTYVAATLSAVLTLAYFLYRAGFFGGSDE